MKLTNSESKGSENINLKLEIAVGCNGLSFTFGALFRFLSFLPVNVFSVGALVTRLYGDRDYYESN